MAKASSDQAGDALQGTLLTPGKGDAATTAGKAVSTAADREASKLNMKALDPDQQMARANWTEEPVAPVTGKGIRTDAEAAVQAAMHGVKADGMKADGMKAALAGHSKANNLLQGLQNQSMNSATPVVSNGILPGSTEHGSMMDSGSQFSDRGGQNSAQALLPGGEMKASGNAQAVQGHFQQMLHDKSPATMTLFDSMKHIAQSAKQGKTQLDIQLEPAHLGKIQVTLQSDAAKQLHVHISAEQSVTRQMLDQQLPALKQALTQQGFDLSGFSMGSDGGHAFSDSSGHQRASGATASDSHNADIVSAPSTDQQPSHQNSGRLNIHV